MAKTIKFRIKRAVPVTRRANGKKRRTRNISEGFHDSNGVFHPIRGAKDYDASRAGEGTRKPRKKKAPKKAKRPKAKKVKRVKKPARTARPRSAKKRKGRR